MDSPGNFGLEEQDIFFLKLELGFVFIVKGLDLGVVLGFFLGELGREADESFSGLRELVFDFFFSDLRFLYDVRLVIFTNGGTEVFDDVFKVEVFISFLVKEFLDFLFLPLHTVEHIFHVFSLEISSDVRVE